MFITMVIIMIMSIMIIIIMIVIIIIAISIIINIVMIISNTMKITFDQPRLELVVDQNVVPVHLKAVLVVDHHVLARLWGATDADVTKWKPLDST